MDARVLTRRACRSATVLIACLLAWPGAAALAQEAGYDDWNPGYPGFPSDAPRDPAADCASGSDACIHETLEEMRRRFHTVVPVCDHNAVFSLTYLRVTEDIARGVDEGFYPDRPWLARLDRTFARLYFLSYDNWAAGRRHLVPAAWRIAYDSARERRVAGIGNLLLAMNAHVNRDFPFVLAHAGLAGPDGRSRKPDHDSGNVRLRAMYRPMLAELSHRFDETTDDHDVAGTEADDEGVFGVLVAWREGAWRNAERLAAAASDAERRLVARDVEAQAEAQARFILANTAYRPGEGPAARDARCARFGGQDPTYRRLARRRAGGVARPLLGRPLRASRRGRVAVSLTCRRGGGDCAGTLTLRARNRRLGRRSFAVSDGRRATVSVALTRAGRELLRRRRQVLARVVVRSSRPGARAVTVTATTSLTLAVSRR